MAVGSTIEELVLQHTQRRCSLTMRELTHMSKFAPSRSTHSLLIV